jgi:hypothetical protein
MEILAMANGALISVWGFNGTAMFRFFYSDRSHGKIKGHLLRRGYKPCLFPYSLLLYKVVV